MTRGHAVNRHCRFGLGLGLVHRGIGRGIHDDVRRQCAHGAGNVGRAHKVGAGLIMGAQRNDFTERRKAALQFPADLAVFTEEKDSHEIDRRAFILTPGRATQFATAFGRPRIVTSGPSKPCTSPCPNEQLQHLHLL